MINKKLSLRSIERSISPQRSISQVNNVRIMDLCFPLDASLLASNAYDFKPFDAHFNFKKIDTLIHEREKNEWTFVLEERYPDNVELKGIQNMQMVISWLNGMGHYLGMSMSEMLSSYINKSIISSQMMRLAFAENKNKFMIEQNSDEEKKNEKNEFEKTYLLMLSPEINDYINDFPWIKRVSRSDLERKKGSCYTFIANSKYFEITGCEPK